jgi:hypothetical protein
MSIARTAADHKKEHKYDKTDFGRFDVGFVDGMGDHRRHGG